MEDAVMLFRFLEETNNTKSDSDDECPVYDDTETLRNTLQIYGGIFVICFLIFCKLRLHCPKTYAVRREVAQHKTYLADSSYGYLSWLLNVFLIPDGVFLEECGMDALCLVRIQDFGWRISLFTMLNAAWLVPLYATSSSHEDTACVNDFVVQLSIANVPPGSYRLVGSAIACYLIFGYTMYSVLLELKWHALYRHQFLARRKERNYTLFLRFLPEEYQSNAKLLQYFRELFSDETVVIESNLALKMPNLAALVAERDALIIKLEHAMNVLRVEETTPMHSTKLLGGEKVESIPAYEQELRALNIKVASALSKMKGIDDSEMFQKGMSDAENGNPSEELAPQHQDDRTSLLASIIPEQDDGEKTDAAFISFSSLRVARAALQMQHHEDPHTMEGLEAPDPSDILWGNVGKGHKTVQIGTWLSFGLTTALLLFWTFVIAFASSLSSLEGLEGVSFIGSMIDKAPWLAPVLAQIAPFIVVIVQALLKTILTAFANMEGPISGAMLESKVFTKLAWFMIIQNFFVLSLSGGLLTAYEDILDSPSSAIGLLATSLPAQSTFHVQILLVNVFISLALELLRVVPVIIAKIRDTFGTDLTDKEKNAAWMGLRALSDPDAFTHASYTAWSILYFLVLFVYSTIAPITSVFLALCFLLMGAAYRHQFIYIYPVRPDSGGKLFGTFMNLVLNCMVIAELTVLGLYGIKLSAIATTMMIPLLLFTIGFIIYVRQQHFSVADHLPGRKALLVDLNHDSVHGTFGDSTFLNFAYTQPELTATPNAKPDPLATGDDTYSKQDLSSGLAGLSADSEDVDRSDPLGPAP